MQVRELIVELKKQLPDSPAVIRGPEGGLEDVSYVDLILVKFDVFDDGFRGPHNQVFQVEEADVLGVRIR